MRDKNNLKRPTIADRIRCNDIGVVTVNRDGSMTVKNAYAALVEWACVGLECSVEELEKFADDEIRDIAERTKAMADLPLGKE